MSEVVMFNEEIDFSGPVAIDTETTGLWWRHGGMPFAISLCDQHFNSLYFEWWVDPFTRKVNYEYFGNDNPVGGFGESWSSAKVHEYLAKYLQDPTVRKVFHNAKFDIGHLSSMGINVEYEVPRPSGFYDTAPTMSIDDWTLHDTSYMARVFNSDEPTYGLKPLSQKYANVPIDDITFLKQVVQKLRRRARRQNWMVHESEAADYWLVQQAKVLFEPEEIEDLDKVTRASEEYCRKDTLRTMALYKKYWPEFEQDKGMMVTYLREMQLLPLVMQMENLGVSVDRSRAVLDREHSVSMAKKHLASIRKFAENEEFNPNSPQQLSGLVYGPKIGLEPSKFTSTGQASADYKTLKDSEYKHPILHDIIQYKAHDKVVSTFFDKFLDLMLEDTQFSDRHVIHPNFNQANTRTGRFSCNEPNLQQVSSPDSSFKGGDVIQARGPFGPRPGWRWALIDYLQMELRIFAGCAHVESIMRDILEGRDPNTEISNRAWGGKGNPTAIRQATLSMELGMVEPSSQDIRKVWKEYGWSSEMALKGERSTEALMVGERWLRDHNYDIVAAEKTIGKKITRNRAKMVMFAKLYGGGAQAVQGLLYCSRVEAQEFMDAIDRAYPQINRYMRRLTREALDEGYIVNKYGRRLTIPAERAYTCVNYMIQGTAADMMKLSMLNCDRWIRQNGIEANLVMTIHDEIVFEIKNEWFTPETLKGLKFHMEDHEKYVGVPMEVGIKQAKERWSEYEDLEFSLS